MGVEAAYVHLAYPRGGAEFITTSWKVLRFIPFGIVRKSLSKTDAA